MRPNSHDGAAAVSRNWSRPPLAPAPPVLINTSSCCKQQDWTFTLVCCISTITFNTGPILALGEKNQFWFYCWKGLRLHIWHFTVEIQLSALKDERKQNSVPNLLAGTLSTLIILPLCWKYSKVVYTSQKLGRGLHKYLRIFTLVSLFQAA